MTGILSLLLVSGRLYRGRHWVEEDEDEGWIEEGVPVVGRVLYRLSLGRLPS